MNVRRSRVWALPDEPAPVRLMSTIWAGADGLHDDLRAPRDLDEWLDAVGIDRNGAAATPRELASARVLRDALRRLAAHLTADDRPAAASAVADPEAAIDAVNAIAARLPAPALKLRRGRLDLGVESDLPAATAGLARVAAEAVQLLGGDDAARLRACHAPGCVLYFVRSHPRRQWCSVACGNRARAARHYARTRQRR